MSTNYPNVRTQRSKALVVPALLTAAIGIAILFLAAPEIKAAAAVMMALSIILSWTSIYYFNPKNTKPLFHKHNI